ncbi:MAG TPA: MarR family transcriptional regulator [Aliiroseovarius sp.]|nr:MarR family transcriptional regulator [Aliiroseovarius sp.]
MSERSTSETVSIALISEIFMTGQLTRNALSRALPKGMELSQFSVLNHLAHASGPKSPAQLARAFHLTRGAMTNTLSKLEWAGHVHIHPDWDDARRKMVTISPAGRAARDAALAAIAPIIADVVGEIGEDEIRTALPVLRALREKFGEMG